MRNSFLCLIFSFMVLLLLPSCSDSPTKSEQDDGKAMQESSDESSRNLMAINEVTISQGEDGVELWNLTAESAEMQNEGGIILVQSPLLRYYVDASKNTVQNIPVTVKALSGEVDQANNIVRFMQDVIANRETNTMKSSTLEYQGAIHSLLTPNKSFFYWEKGEGQADSGVWNLNTGVFTAQGNVQVEWEMSSTKK